MNESQGEIIFFARFFGGRAGGGARFEPEFRGFYSLVSNTPQLAPAWMVLVNLAKARSGVRDFSPAFDGGIHPAAREKAGQ